MNTDIIIFGISQYLCDKDFVNLILASKELYNDSNLQKKLLQIRAFKEVRDSDKIEQLLARYPDLAFVRNEDGCTLLHLIDSIFSFNALMRSKADLNAQDKDGNTPLHYTAKSVPKIRWLLSHGANIHIRNNCGKTPYYYADYYIGRTLLT